MTKFVYRLGLFHPSLEDIFIKEDKGIGGRTPYEYLLMFKILILQRFYSWFFIKLLTGLKPVFRGAHKKLYPSGENCFEDVQYICLVIPGSSLSHYFQILHVFIVK